MTNIAAAVVRFQADRATIERHLGEIQAAWTHQGIETPVVGESGDIDPDAEIEMLDRLPFPQTGYTLMDADTAEGIGFATGAQAKASLLAGDTGIILIDADGDVVAPQDEHQPWVPQPIRRVYVD